MCDECPSVFHLKCVGLEVSILDYFVEETAYAIGYYGIGFLFSYGVNFLLKHIFCFQVTS